MPRVWCWEDLWRAVREECESGPTWLSAVSAQAALGVAIERARAEGELSTLETVVHWPGVLRRLRERVEGWGRGEWSPEKGPGEEGPGVAEEWLIHGRYRAVLRELGAEDDVGMAAWASRALSKGDARTLRKFGSVTLLGLDDERPAVMRALAFFEANAREVRVALDYDPSHALAEAYSAVSPTRTRLIERGYLESSLAPDLWRKPGLREVERELFRDDAHARPAILDGGGLKLLGAPEGYGVGLMVAREVRRALEARGVAPEDVLVLLRSWDEAGEVVFDVLRSWGLPVSAVGRRRALANAPEISALRMAMRLPINGWETAGLVKLLRHGQFQPSWESIRPLDLAAIASAIRDTRVYRGKEEILGGLDRMIQEERPGSRRRERASSARAFLERLISEIEEIARPGAWRKQSERLLRLAEVLGLKGEAVERLGGAMDDHAAVLDRAGEDEFVSWERFVGEAETLARAAGEMDDSPAPGTMAVSTVGHAAGARGRVVVLANLKEGVFPSRESVEGDEPEGIGRAFAREMTQFLRVLGSASDEVILVYPTRDEKGQELLASGFVDDLRRRLEPKALAKIHEVVERFDPALVDRPELAVAPADARVRALALACREHQGGELARLSTDPRHRAPLHGSAAALRLLAQRLDPRVLGAYDGRLNHAAARALTARFGPNAVFSPSQLESFLLCPFQFFMKYVLKLESVDESDELEEDYMERGDRIHQALEELETRRRDEGGNRLELVDVLIKTEMRVELTGGSEAGPGLRTIENRRLEQTLMRYLDQVEKYEKPSYKASSKGKTKGNAEAATPHGFEVSFGAERGEPSRGELLLGEGDRAVRLRGKIDRVDRVETGQGAFFRVIDYKTGGCPTAADVKNYLMVQLPLYALAVERLGLAGEHLELRDVGYWSLKDEGFKPIALDDWEARKGELEAVVVGAVGRLRDGFMVIDPRKDDCTRTCDFKSVCRITQVRAVSKAGERGTP